MHHAPRNGDMLGAEERSTNWSGPAFSQVRKSRSASQWPPSEQSGHQDRRPKRLHDLCQLGSRRRVIFLRLELMGAGRALPEDQLVVVLGLMPKPDGDG